jgi:hypothetical protein
MNGRINLAVRNPRPSELSDQLLARGIRVKIPFMQNVALQLEERQEVLCEPVIGRVVCADKNPKLERSILQEW